LNSDDRLMPDTEGVTTVNYSIYMYDEEFRSSASFSAEEKRMLRPIAETLAMLDGNAFFGISTPDAYDGYLPEAWALFVSSGGENGWAGRCSWIREPPEHQIPAVRQAWENYQTVLNLCRGENDSNAL